MTRSSVLRRGQLLVAGVFVATAVLAGASPSAAKFDQLAYTRPNATPPVIDRRKANELVKRVQKGLAATNLYDGPLDGRLGSKTEQAIRAYQRRNGLKVDGLVSEKLASHLETATNVRSLLERLDQTRRDNIDSAREALLSSPATRGLLRQRQTDVADPTRDASPCFRDPTVNCLLQEAAESAKAIAKDNMRDWALGELLAAQAKAGLVRAAMITVGRIEDPRLIMVALREIAEAQALAGRGAEALAATEIIPDTQKQVEALVAIADIQARRGDAVGARETVAHLVEALKTVRQALMRVAFYAKGAAVLALAGDLDAGLANLKDAEALARSQKRRGDRSVGLRHIAVALAEMGRPLRALAILREADDRADQTPLLVAAAKALARLGDADGALATAQDIEAARYRAVVLCSIAAAYVRAGNGIAAEREVSQAEAAIEEIEFPYARAFALSRVALALSDIGRINGAEVFDRAEERAAEISDIQLRSQVLWTVAAERRRNGDGSGATRTQTLAEDASREIKSSLSRVWMFSDIAVNHLALGERDAAWKALNRALDSAENIHNAWGRARALSKIAATLSEFAEDRQAVAPRPL